MQGQVRPPIRVTLGVLVLAWVAPAFAQSSIFTDTFTEATSNVDLASHVPDVGTAWAEVIDTSGNRTISVYQSTDAIAAATTSNQRIVYRATAVTPCGEDCDIEFEIRTLTGSATDTAALIFGYVDTSNYCALVVYNATPSVDVAVVKVVSGTASDLASGTADTNPVNGDVFRVERRGSDITIDKNDVAILTPSDAACNGGNGTGVGFGNIRVSTDDMNVNYLVDNFAVVDQTAGGPPPGGGTGGGGGLLRRSGGR
jgi:hypothetical protein